MTTYAAKPVKVDAVRYDAPTADDDEGSIAELAAFGPEGIQVVEQAPWNPTEGQAGLLLSLPENEERGWVFLGVIKPGDYLVKNARGEIYIHDGTQFEAEFIIPTE